MASPYYVAPQGGYDIGAGLSGLASSIDRRRQMEAEEAERQRAIEVSEAATKKFAAAKTAAMDAYRSGDPDQIAQVMMAYPEVSAALNQSVNFKSKATRDNMLESLRIGIVSPERIPELIKTRAEFVRSQGGDPNQTEAELARYEKDPNAYVQSLKSTWAALDFPSFNQWRSASDDSYGETKIGAREILPNGTIVLAPDKGPPIVYTASGKRLTGEDAENAVKVGREYGVDVASRTAGARTRATLETERELSPSVKAAEAGATATGKTQAERDQGFIDAGISAAEQIPTINRALDLLDQVETGGWAGAAKSVSDFLGTTSEDTGELNSLLGRAIVGSLRSTFGGNPTEGERAALAKIEASIGQGKGVNKALLKNALVLAKVRINRAKRAAERTGDKASAESIDELLGVKLGEQPQDQPPAQVETPQKRILKFNPATGKLE